MSDLWFYAFNRRGDADRPMFDTAPDSRRRLWLFSSCEKARQFADEKMSPHDPAIVEMNLAATIQWLEAVRSNPGVDAVWLDPDPIPDAWPAMYIDALLENLRAHQ